MQGKWLRSVAAITLFAIASPALAAVVTIPIVPGSLDGANGAAGVGGPGGDGGDASATRSRGESCPKNSRPKRTPSSRGFAGAPYVSALSFNTIKVEVPWARTRPLASVTRASAEMMRRPLATTHAAARTRPVSLVIGREKFTFVSIVA